LAAIPNFMESMIKEVLFYRPPTRYSGDKPNPTFYESVIQKTLKPLIEEEVKKVAEANRKELSRIIKTAFKTNVIDNADFENRLIDQLSRFTSDIRFYVSAD